MKINITWYGTACFILDFGNYRIMLDPFLDRNAKSQPVLPTKKEDVPRIDAILVTHAHFDHVTSIPFLLHRDHCRLLGNAQVKVNIERLGIGKGLPGFPDRIDPSDLASVESVTPGTAYPLQKNGATIATVTPIQSEHIHFDAYQILRVAFNWNFLTHIRKLAVLGKAFPKGNVLGYEIVYQGKRIIVFGSLNYRNMSGFTKFSPCDLLFIPLAGRTNITQPGLDVTHVFQPRIVIPTHYDHFYPPISQWTDLTRYEARMKQEMPETLVIRPGIGTPYVVDL
jgi:L-ascorbate metabolism protein UlaG (beta-lactamase superfamily)